MAYESVKIYDDDYERAKAIRADRGITIIEAIGAAIEAWSMVPREVQDAVIRARSQRQHATPAPSAA